MQTGLNITATYYTRAVHMHNTRRRWPAAGYIYVCIPVACSRLHLIAYIIVPCVYARAHDAVCQMSASEPTGCANVVMHYWLYICMCQQQAGE
jgi:hypothetical protein